MEALMKPNLYWLLIPALLIVVALVFDSLAAVRPAMPPAREGEPEPRRPAAEDEPFHIAPIAPTFAERQQMYRDWVSAQPTPDDRGGVWTDIVKLANGAESINETAFRAALEFVNARQDPSDFTFNALIRMYALFRGTGKLTAAQEAAIEDAILNWKYWLDEPGTTYVEMWTENHQILNHSAEYLAGQMFPDSVFTNNGQTGRWHMEHARPLILQWIELRARAGFSEWDSETYYPEDLAPLLNLVDFAEDPEIATRAAMLVDVILFDTAVDSFYGQFATSHGRVTASSIKSANGSMTTINALAWGQGKFISTTNMGAVALATTTKYEVPPVIQALALDNPQEYFNYERHSFDVADAPRYGLDLADLRQIPRFWGLGAFTTPDVIDYTIRAADAWNLWHYPDFKDLKEIAKFLQAVNGLPLASRLLDPDPNGILMSEVNKVSYRTPDYMLSSAQSFRPGGKGYQQHIWQATLGPYAVVFTNHPDSLRADDKHRPSYWMGNGRQPRAAQYKNVLVALYDIPRYPSAPRPLEARHYAFTHAYFPKWAFDEVAERSGWVFGRHGDGYIALYSALPYQWVTEGPDADQEIVAPGYRNVWIVQLGRASVDGSFQDFIAAITAAPLKVDGLNVRFDSPGNGLLEFDWTGGLTVAGQAIPLTGYPRFENPYARVEFGGLKYLITFQGQSLELDFETGARAVK